MLATIRQFTIFTIIFIMFVSNAMTQFDRPDPDQMPSFSVGPLDMALTGRANQTLTSKIVLVTRKFESPVTFQIDKMDLGQEDGNGAIPVDPGKGSRSCIDWINITNEVVAKPDDRIEIPFSIRIPNDVQGSYFAYINVTTKPRKPEGAFVVLVKYRLPVTIELNIPGPAQLRLNTTELAYEQGGYNKNDNIVLKIKNEGFWKTSLEGEILLRNLNSGQQTVAQIPYATTGNPLVVYPGLDIPVKCEIPVHLEAGKYLADVRLLMNKFGRTQAHFEFSVGRTSNVAAENRSREEFDIDIHVSPDIIELPLRPGAVRNIPVIIRNNDKREISVRASLHRVQMQPNGSFLLLSDGGDIDTTFIQTETTDINIAPKRTQSIKVKISVPENYQMAFSHAYAIRISSLPTNKKPDNDWGSRGESIIPIVAYDALAPQATLQTQQFDIIRPSPGLNPTACVLRVKNTGLKAGKLNGKIQIADDQGKEIGHLDIGVMKTELILPHGEREFRAMIPTLYAGGFKVKAMLNMVGRNKNVYYEEIAFDAIGVNP